MPASYHYSGLKDGEFMEKKQKDEKDITIGSTKALIGILGLALAAVVLLVIIRVFFL